MFEEKAKHISHKHNERGYNISWFSGAPQTFNLTKFRSSLDHFIDSSLFHKKS